MRRKAHVHTEVEWELWPRLHASSNSPLYLMLHCILKQVQITHVRADLCYWHADHRWALAGHIHHPWPCRRSLPRLSHRVRGSGLFAPVPFGAHLCRVRAPWRWSLLSSLDSKVVGNQHFVSHVFVSSQCLTPHNDSKMSNEWMNEWTFYRDYPENGKLRCHGKSSLGSEHIHILD